MEENNCMSWRDDAIKWIQNAPARLPNASSDRWRVEQPSPQAQETAIQVIKILGADVPAPSAMVVTPDRGIELEWRHGNKLLSIEILADGELESLKSIGGEPV
jgi:hypothetical protein